MKYKVGDKVRIKSLQWYEDNRDEYGNVLIEYVFTNSMSEWCGKTITVDRVFKDIYRMKEDDNYFSWTDDMIEGLADETPEPKQRATPDICLTCPKQCPTDCSLDKQPDPRRYKIAKGIIERIPVSVAGKFGPTATATHCVVLADALIAELDKGEAK